MVAIDQAVVQAFIDTGVNAQTTTERGRALEDLICYVFGLVPGIAVTHRNEMNVFDTEEVDVALWNDGTDDGFHALPNLILVECKNWSNAVGSGEVAWFMTKLKNRGLDFGILISPHGITGNAQDLTAAHHVVAVELAEKRRLLLITTQELMAVADTGELALLIKKKLCDLAVKGTIA
jgi:predicted helicase